MAKLPTCDTPGCGRPIPKGGEGHPEICPTCLACLKLHGTQVQRTEHPEMVEEWQVTPGDSKTCHVFTSKGAVFGFLASEWQKFTLSASDGRTCSLHVDVRHVMREKHPNKSKNETE